MSHEGKITLTYMFEVPGIPYRCILPIGTHQGRFLKLDWLYLASLSLMITS